ncbi:MAG: ISAs1 family transposase, partial [Sphaerochaeta sp.]|nr:ISAs1 family transposase [Sphaerochaeta sp.]
MDPNSTRGRDLFMEIREAMDSLGRWEADAKAGRKVIDRFVSILKKGIADPRVKGKVSYPLSEIIVLSFFATLGGAMTFQDMEVMCTCKQKYFRKFIPLKAGIPSHDTFNRVFSLIDMGEFNKALTDFIKESMEELRKVLHIPEPQMVQLCVDGKEARGSGRQEDADGKVKRNIQTLHVYSSYNGICLKSSQIEQKSNEIPMAQEVLATMDLRKTLVSFDAMNTQRQTIKVIVDQGGHYLGGLKGNQKTLLEESAAYFTPDYLKRAESDPNLYHRTLEKAHGQIEERVYTVAKVRVTDDCEFSDWPGMKAVIRFDKKTEKVNTGKKTKETRYYITSLANNAQVCGEAIKKHWLVLCEKYFNAKDLEEPAFQASGMQVA